MYSIYYLLPFGGAPFEELDPKKKGLRSGETGPARNLFDLS